MRVLSLLVALSLTGCVSKSKYAALETRYDAVVQERDAAQVERDQAKQDLEDRKAPDRKAFQQFSAAYRELFEVEAQNLAKVDIEDGRAVLRLDADVLFASGSAALSSVGATAVASIAKALAKGSGEFQVEGHTDSDPIKNTKEFPSNYHLGADRSIVVAQEMIKAGFPKERLSASTFGDTNPVGDNATEGGKKLNRRIEIVWVPELSEVLPYRRMMKQLEDERSGQNPAK